MPYDGVGFIPSNLTRPTNKNPAFRERRGFFNLFHISKSKISH
ncbi:MAG: hypothetical protein US83_C0009G0024 [Candidatus Falkowbacteria bacterium GW2011_GWC2_38_22]|nr:MAG: hypothetical protein US73_C0012G0024 [Candidatus Falkowbacteria bacterium GW2011_GWF2_38_1205]KKQ61118.1 MAG: hypothetical protein US83_C0009G0024 [Candidatus Falkowbacteria bacterium GW2011_GWC2_38_22]